jgi:hypothetical protein
MNHTEQTTNPDHRDITPADQPYIDGMFVSICSCGAEFTGRDGDEADADLFEHTATAS